MDGVFRAHLSASCMCRPVRCHRRLHAHALVRLLCCAQVVVGLIPPCMAGGCFSLVHVPSTLSWSWWLLLTAAHCCRRHRRRRRHHHHPRRRRCRCCCCRRRRRRRRRRRCRRRRCCCCLANADIWRAASLEELTSKVVHTRPEIYFRVIVCGPACACTRGFHPKQQLGWLCRAASDVPAKILQQQKFSFTGCCCSC